MAMGRELDNANPTIVNVSDLPTRRRDKRNNKVVQLVGDDGVRWSTSQGIFGDEDAEDVGVDVDSDDGGDPIDEQEIYDLIATISDPEHPLTLGQLAVVNLPDIHIDPPPTPGQGPDLQTLTTVTVDLTPTINHCSLATIIGLAVRARLEACLPPNYRLDVKLKEGTHAQDEGVTKQLADKERVAAALENDSLRRHVDNMLTTCVDIYADDDGE